MSIVVRDFYAEDAPQALVLARAFHAESRYSRFDFDENKILRLFATSLVDDGFVFLVAVDGDTLIGGFGLQITEYYFGKDLTATDLFLFVDRNRRGGKAAILMIQEGLTRAAQQGCREVVLGVATEINTEAVERLYQKMGFRKIGAYYSKEI